MSLLSDFEAINSSFGKFQALKVAKIFIFDISKLLTLKFLPFLRVKKFEFW